jgi:hypothetical protein
MITMAAPPWRPSAAEARRGRTNSSRIFSGRIGAWIVDCGGTEAPREVRQGGRDVGSGIFPPVGIACGDFFGGRISYLLLYFASGSGRFLI